jgi:hypothetical protein
VEGIACEARPRRPGSAQSVGTVWRPALMGLEVGYRSTSIAQPMPTATQPEEFPDMTIQSDDNMKNKETRRTAGRPFGSLHIIRLSRPVAMVDRSDRGAAGRGGTGGPGRRAFPVDPGDERAFGLVVIRTFVHN